MVGDVALHVNHTQIFVVEVGRQLQLIYLFVALSGFALDPLNLNFIMLPVLFDFLVHVRFQKIQKLFEGVAERDNIFKGRESVHD